ncbi:MAG: rubrerythrin family protein, partial [Candidatus Helarchaeales archaeon]
MPNTEENLKTAFAGESQANRKYLAFSKKAEQDGFPNIARMFKAIAEAETVHALNHFRALGMVKSTAENLQAAIDGEHYEINEMYPPMVETAKKEGHKEGERSTRDALETEKVHEVMYKKALETVKSGKDIEKTNYAVCPVCGYTMEGDELPDNCPICKARKD